MHFKSASDLRELEILERRKIRAVEDDYGDDEEEEEEEDDDDDRFHSGSSSGLGYPERSTRSQARSTNDLLGKADYRRLMASGLVSSSASASRLSRSQSILVTTPSPTTSVFTRRRRQLPKCPQESGAPPPPPPHHHHQQQQQQTSHLARQQSMLEGTTRERLEKMTRNRMLRDQILQDQMSQAAATPVVPELPREGESPPLQGRRLHAVSRQLSRRRSFLEKARETIRTATTAAAASSSSSSGVEPLPGLRSRPSLARRTSFLDSKPVRKMAKLARR